MNESVGDFILDGRYTIAGEKCKENTSGTSEAFKRLGFLLGLSQNL